MNKLFTFLVSLSTFLFLGVVVASAQGYIPLAPLPGTLVEGTKTADISSYISGAIKLLIALGAGLSILFAVIGGTQYVAAGISPDAKSGAKERIVNSFVGLALVLSSYLLLLSINPRLVEFNLKLDRVTPAPLEKFDAVVSTTLIGSACLGIAPLTPLTGGAALMEGGQNVLFSTSNPDVQENLNKLKAETDKLHKELQKNGGSASINSAYRPIEYQSHLYGIFSKWALLKNNNTPECSSLRSAVQEENERHGLGGSVSLPTGCSTHVKGTGVDITIKGLPYEEINAFMSERGIDLTWQNAHEDKWHFNLKNPPYIYCPTV